MTSPAKITRRLSTERIKEHGLRVLAAGRGYRLERCLRTDPRAIGYGGYMLFDAARGFVVCGDSPHAYSATLADLEAFLEPDDDGLEAARLTRVAGTGRA